MKRTIAAGLMAAVLIVQTAGCAGPSKDNELPAPDPSPAVSAPRQVNPNGVESSEECIVRDDLGEPIWTGQASGELTAVGDALQSIVDSHPDLATGVAYCSAFEGVVIFVAAQETVLLESIERVRQESPEVRVIVDEVPAPLSLLIDISTDLMSQLGPEVGITALGPDVHSGGLYVGLSSEDSRSTAERFIESHLIKDRGLDLPVRYRVEGAGENSLDTSL